MTSRDVRYLRVRMELRNLDLTKIPKRVRTVVVEYESTSTMPMLTAEEWAMTIGVPNTLHHRTVMEMGISTILLSKWRTDPKNPTKGLRLFIPVGLLDIGVTIPDSQSKRTCSDCKRPLALFILQMDWDVRLHGNVIERGTWCPACNLRHEWLEDSKGKEGFHKIKQGQSMSAALDWARQDAKNTEREYVTAWTSRDKTWWESQREKKTPDFLAFIDDLRMKNSTLTL